MVYLLEENKVLKARLCGRKLRLTEDERRRLAVKGKALGRKLLADGVKIDLCSIDRLVAEPEGDHRSVDPSVEQPHCGRVAQYVCRDLLGAKSRAR